MNVVDTSGWLEYFTGGENSKKFAKAIKETNILLKGNDITNCIFLKRGRQFFSLSIQIQTFKFRDCKPAIFFIRFF